MTASQPVWIAHCAAIVLGENGSGANTHIHQKCFGVDAMGMRTHCARWMPMRLQMPNAMWMTRRRVCLCGVCETSWLTCRLKSFPLATALTHHRKVQNLSTYHFFDWLFTMVLISNFHIYQAPNVTAQKTRTQTTTQCQTESAGTSAISSMSLIMPLNEHCWILSKFRYPLCMRQPVFLAQANCAF